MIGYKLKKIDNLIDEANDKEIEKYKSDLRNKLTKFELGEYLIKKKSLNGYWTHYIVTHEENEKNSYSNELEFLLLNKFPTVKATQERYKIFLRENQEKVRDCAIIASMPSGLCGDLLYLDYSHVKHINIIAIDNDESSLKLAVDLAEKLKLKDYFEVRCSNIWNLKLENEFDLISSNGLNIYFDDDVKLVELFKMFYSSLKINGKLVTSFLTYPPHLTNNCEWDFSKINENDLLHQKIMFTDIIEAKWQCFSSSNHIINQLESVGFRDINIIYDQARLFPTVVAYK